MTLVQIQGRLSEHGFPAGAPDGVLGPMTKAAVARFQRAYNGPWLELDGIPGPKTIRALEMLPRLSEHFVVGELACRHCGQCCVRRELLAALEGLRDAAGAPVVLASAYRCPEHNRAVGGAPRSMHLEGYAADLKGGARVPSVVRLRLFSGVGDRGGVVRHVDLRHLSDANTTRDATVASPARWHY